MNDRFFLLPQERQTHIINAALKVFAQSDYRHASMADIAGSCNISKSLLFHYFTNKEELYHYLWDYSAQITIRATADYGITDTKDPFELLRRSTKAKCHLMREYPFLQAFSTRAYYEIEPVVESFVRSDIRRYAERGTKLFEETVDATYLAPGVFPADLFTDFLNLSDGYMLKCYRSGNIDADLIEKDFETIIQRWQRVFGARGTCSKEREEQ